MQLNVTYSLTCFVAKAPTCKAVFGVTHPVAALGATKCTVQPWRQLVVGMDTFGTMAHLCATEAALHYVC